MRAPTESSGPSDGLSGGDARHDPARAAPPGFLTSAFRFVQVGAISFSLGLGITAGLHELAGLPEELAYAAALSTVFATNFLLLRFWTYDGRGRDVRSQLGRFFVASLVFRGSEYLAFLLVHSYFGIHYLPAVIGVESVAAIAKFLLYGRLVFEAPARSVSATPRRASPSRTTGQGGGAQSPAEGTRSSPPEEKP